MRQEMVRHSSFAHSGPLTRPRWFRPPRSRPGERCLTSACSWRALITLP